MRISLDRPFHRVALAAVVVLLLCIPWTPARVVAVLVVAGVLPGLGVVSCAPLAADAALAIGASISPVIFGVCVLVAMWAGASPPLATLVASGVGLLLFILFARGSPALSANERRALLGALGIALVAAFLALSLPLSEPWWRVREDSWFHAAVVDKLGRDGLPLTDPYFAGLRLQYMYVYHAIVAACASLAALDSFHAMVLVNAVALFSAVLAFHALAGEFTRRIAPRFLGTCLWVLGLNGWFYLSYPVRLARAVWGDTRGLETLRELFPWTPPGHATAASLLSVEGNQFMFLDKFMIGTAFSLTFGLAASVLLLLIDGRLGRWSKRKDVAFFLCIAGAMLLHLVTGVTIALVTSALLALLLVVRAQTAGGGPSYARLLGWIVLAFAVTAPYVFSVAPREGSASLEFALQGSQAIGLLFAVLPALALAVLFVRRPTRDAPDGLGSRPFSEMSLSATGIVIVWTLLVTMAALTVDLATNNETKFAFLVFLPLAALAAGQLGRWWDSPRTRALAVVLVASATIPLHVIYYSHAARDANTFDVSDAERAVYGWMKETVPRDAVVLEENDIVRVPVLASRDLYWGTEGYARNWGYPQDEMVARKRLRDAVFSHDGPTEADLVRLRGLTRPVFVVYRVHPDELIDAHERFEKDARFQGRFATDEIAVWELRVNE